jgi:hypothetical protein
MHRRNGKNYLREGERKDNSTLTRGFFAANKRSAYEDPTTSRPSSTASNKTVGGVTWKSGMMISLVY